MYIQGQTLVIYTATAATSRCMPSTPQTCAAWAYMHIRMPPEGWRSCKVSLSCQGRVLSDLSDRDTACWSNYGLIPSMLLILLLHVWLCCYVYTLLHRMCLQQFACSNLLAAQTCVLKMLGSVDNIAKTSCLGFVDFLAEQPIIRLKLRNLYQAGKTTSVFSGKTYCHQQRPDTTCVGLCCTYLPQRLETVCRTSCRL